MIFTKNISEKIIISGIVLLILLTLIGWQTRYLWAISIVEIIILCLLVTAKFYSPRKESLPFSLVVFFIIAFIATIFSTYFYNSWLELLKLAAFISAFWLVRSQINSKRQIKIIIYAILGAGLIAAIYGLVNFFQLQDFSLGIASFFGWRNVFGGYILLVLPLSLCVCLTTYNKIKLFLTGLTSLLLLTCLYFTFSQAAWLAFSLSCFLVFLFLLIKKFSAKKIITRSLVIIILTIVLCQGLIQLRTYVSLPEPKKDLGEVSQVQSLGVSNRLDYWQTSLDIFKHYPWFGVGPGNFSTIYPRHQQNIWSFASSPHNYFLFLLAEVGIFGLIFFIIFLWQTLRKGVKFLRAKQPVENNNYIYALGLLSSLAASLIHALLDVDWEGMPAIFLLFFIEAGLVWKITQQTPSFVTAVDTCHDTYLQRLQILGAKTLKKQLTWFLVLIIVGGLITCNLLADSYYQQAKRINEETMGQSSQSVEALNKAAWLSPWRADLYGELSKSYYGLILEHQGDREENFYYVIKYAQKALLLEPENAQNHHNLGFAYYFSSNTKDEEIKKAETYYQSALEKNPYNRPDYYLALGQLYFRTSNYSKVLEISERALTIFNEEDVDKIFWNKEEKDKFNQTLEEIKRLKEISEEAMSSANSNL